MTYITIILILLLLLFILIAVVLIYTTHITAPKPATATPINNISTFGQPCNFYKLNNNKNDLNSSGVCGPGLICSSNNLCINDLNTPCLSLAQCSSAATVCSGRCTTGPVGNLNQNCPCNDGLSCVPQASGFNVCKLNGGAVCATDNDCVAKCVNNVCTTGRVEGQSCISSNECGTGLYCSIGFCQLNGITTGAQNAFCLSNSIFSPNCSTPLTCVDNRCNSTFGEFGDNCTNTVCNLPLECKVQQSAQVPTDTVNVCIYKPNNKCDKTCISGFTCTPGIPTSKCLANTGMTCLANNNCTSGTCTGTPGLFKWTGTRWLNVGTPPNETFKRLQVAKFGTNLYTLSTAGIRKFDGSNWTLVYTSSNNIIDFTVDYTEKIWILLDTGTSDGRVIVDSNNVPTTKFNTPAGNLIINNIVITIANFDIDIQGDIISTDTTGRLYISSTQVSGIVNASLPRTYGNFAQALNYSYYVPGIGVTGVGQLLNNVFPRLPVEFANYNIISDYSIFGKDFVSLTIPPGNLDITTSAFYAIASSDNINYSVILNTGTYQSILTAYVDINSKIANNENVIYLYNKKVCA
jgi:hypothetical protein